MKKLKEEALQKEELREMEEAERELASLSPGDLKEASPEEAVRIERDLRALADAYLQRKKKVIGVRVSMADYLELERRARERGLTPSAILRLLLKHYLSGKIKPSL